MTKYKHYVVWRGRNVGIFDSWQSCKEQIDKFEGAVYKGCAFRAEAVEVFEAGMPTFAKHRQAKPKASPVVGTSALTPEGDAGLEKRNAVAWAGKQGDCGPYSSCTHKLYFDGVKDMMKYYFKKSKKDDQIYVSDYYKLNKIAH